jgi:amino acid adenylation domain-containing protein/non-ribosomal peptide synthase protein (TIGR01720 family)
MEYNRELFDPETAKRMLAIYRHLLRQVLTDPSAALQDYDLLDDAQRRQIESFNETPRNYDLSRPLHALIASESAESSSAAAVSTDSGDSISHAELHRRSDALAGHLLSIGMTPGSLIGVCIQRSIELEVALLAILKCGSAYVPLDPSYPTSRLEMMLADANITCLLCHEPTQDACGSMAIEKLSLVSADRPDSWKVAPWPLPRVSPGDLAYMIFTSGSTGKPKGAMNEHRGIVNRLLWMQEQFNLTPDDVVLQKTPASFDVSVWEFFWPMLAGARLHMARPGGHQDPEYLAEVIQTQRVTTLHFVPSMLWAFLQCAGAARCNNILRRVICSGEALGFDLKERFFKILPDVELHNLYGPTEAAVDVTHHICRPARDAHGASKIVPIGRPIANTQIRILDGKLRPLPIGVPGELHIGGVQVGRGYFNRPELTESKFIPDPFDHTGKGRLYKTGDLARWLPNGEIDFLGRLDFQVKIRGQRIELGEVESALLSLPNVQDAAAAARGKSGEDQRLVGYLVLSVGAAKPGVEEIRSHLSGRLPDGMIPSQFVFMDKLPLSANGKLDRKMLPDAAPGDRSTLKQAYAAPTTSVQRKLAEIWQQVLKLPQIGIHDNFFALGGDSILSLQIIARANTAGLKLAARDIFQRQTIAQLAGAGVEATPVNIEQGPVVGSAPLLPIQHWFLSQDQPRPDHFNQAIMLLPARPLDHQRLGAAFEHMMRHHDALRLRVTRSSTGWSQEILPPDVAQEAILSVANLSNVADPLLSQAIERHATEAQESLSLNQGHVIRAVLLQLRHSQRLLIVIHHMAVDGMSWRVLLEDLQTAYEQLERGQAVQLPPKTVSVRDWARMLHEHSRSSEISKQADDWQKLIAGAPAPMPVDAPTAANMNTAADAHELAVSLDEETTRRLLRDASEAYKTQINDLLLTALAMAYREWTGSGEILIDLEGHGREALDGVSIDVGRTVGWFTSLYPVRLSLPSGSDIGDSVIAIKEQIRKVPANGLSYGVLRYFGDDATRQRLASLPQPQICFNYLGQMDGAFDAKALFSLSDDPIGPSRSPLTRRPWLIELNAAVTADRFRLQVAYNASLHRRGTIERFAQSFLDALRRIIDRCTSQVATRHTPSDFALAGLDQDDLDQLAGLLGGDA